MGGEASGLKVHSKVRWAGSCPSEKMGVSGEVGRAESCLLEKTGVSGEASARLEWGRHTVLGKTATSKLVSWYRNVNL